MKRSHITVIINGHREGLLAVPSLKSVEQAVGRAAEEGLVVQILAVLDRPDDLTREVFQQWLARQPNAMVVPADFGDLGLSRNLGVAQANGKWIAFLDADDMWGSNWLAAAYRVGEEEARRVIWHPEMNLYFGIRPHAYLHIDMDDPSFRLAALAFTNLWTALSFTERKVLAETPYRFTSMVSQIGFEDWGWNIETITSGIVHKIVPGTVHAVRTKAVSLVGQTTANACLPHSTKLFRLAVAQSIGEL